MTQTANVTQLPAAKAGEPVQFSMRTILPDGRDITATVAHYPDSRVEVNALLDNTMAALDRLRAKYEIVDLEEKIAEADELLAQEAGALERLDQLTSERVKALQTKALTARQGRQNKFDSLSQEADEKGRSFDENKPGNRRELDVFDREAKEAEDEARKLLAEREAGHKNSEATKVKMAEDLAKLHARLKTRQKIVNS